MQSASARACSGRRLQFETLEDRWALSANLGSLDEVVAPKLNSNLPTLDPNYWPGLTPGEVRSYYGFDGVQFGGVAGDGAGQTIAIVNARNNPNIFYDLAVFDQRYGLPAPPSFTVVNQTGGSKLPKNSKTWASEIALDVEWAHAIAPAANILLVEAKSASMSNFLAAIDYARHVPGVSVVSMSAGGKEFKSESAADGIFTTPTNHTGVTFVVAASDEGAKPEYPSSSPNVLSVGGTTAYGDGTETVWSGGGGGVSKYEGSPSYQNGLGLLSRGTPDVSYAADPENGFAVFDSYGSKGWAQFGGTSAGTPQWAALLAIANQGRVLAGKTPLSNAQAALYSLPSSDFYDVVYGSNGYTATPGYDLASGLGTPVANAVITDLVAYDSSTAFTVAAIPPGKKPKKSASSRSVRCIELPPATSVESIAAAPFGSSIGAGISLMPSRTTSNSRPANPSPFGNRALLPNDGQAAASNSLVATARRTRGDNLALDRESGDSPTNAPMLGDSVLASIDCVFTQLNDESEFPHL